MKKIIFILMLLPIGLAAQTKEYKPLQLASAKILPKLKLVEVPPLPAQASITITIVDGTATLADVRDTLCSAWGYTGNPNDNNAKLAFLKAFLINKIVSDYAQQKTVNSLNSFSTQITIN